MDGKRVYFDTMVFIYLVEGFAELEKQLLEIRDSLLRGEAEVFTSELTRCETLVVPFRNNAAKLIANYREFIESSGAFTVQPASRETWLRAGLYRAQFGLKAPDAIHMATAVETDCEVFVTNDAAIKAPRGMRVARLGEYP
jgi:predicted nucleic acid-binding protein